MHNTLMQWLPSIKHPPEVLLRVVRQPAQSLSEYAASPTPLACHEKRQPTLGQWRYLPLLFRSEKFLSIGCAMCRHACMTATRRSERSGAK